MKFLRLAVGLILVLGWLLSSCVKDVSYYQEEIPKGKIIMKNHLPLRVSDNMILEIVDIEDDRCPIGVVCSSVGAVEIKFKAYVDTTFYDLQLNYEDMFDDSGCSTTFEGHVIEIFKVNPHPCTGEDINPNDYLVEIQVDKI